MTEQEAIELLDSFYEMDEMYCAAQIGIKALEEIQQYRAIGTVEKVREYKEIADNMEAVSMAALCVSLNKLKEYQKIGTPEECRTAVEKLGKVEEVVKEWDKVGYAYSNNHMCEIKMIIKGGGENGNVSQE